MSISKKVSDALSGREFSKEHKEKISESLKGHKVSEETKEKLSKKNKGKPSWCKGLSKDTDERIKKISDTLKETTKGRKLSKEHKKAISEGLKGKKRSQESKNKTSRSIRNSKKFYDSIRSDLFKEKMSKIKSGQIPWNKKDFSKISDYGDDFTRKLKEHIQRRDCHKCVLCGKKKLDLILEKYLYDEPLQKLSVHHIDYNKKNNDESNLITLCNSCHGKTNSNGKDAWVAIFDLILGNKERLPFIERPHKKLGTHKPKSEEHKRHISEGLKRTTKNKGKAPWNKGKKNVQVAWNKGLMKFIESWA
jgi:5-methylcytosine-specific restriction endonuclease McrA